MNRPVASPSVKSGRWTFFWDLSFQLSLACVLVSAIFSFFRPEAETSQVHAQNVLISCLGCAIPVVYWVAICSLPRSLKLLLIPGIVGFTWTAGQLSVLEFD